MKNVIMGLALTMALSASGRAADPAAKLPREYDWRKAIANNQALPPGSIDERMTVRIGGIDQSVSVRGTSPDNPLLLYLHGGPGSPQMAEAWTYQRPWEDYFTVVQWDQRGSGKTFGLNGRQLAGPLTIDRMQADAEELIAFLLRRYHKRKIILLGHSWGSILGLRIALHRPDLLYAYVGAGQVVNMRRNEAVGYQLTLDRARQDHNVEAIRQLEAIAPYPKPGVPIDNRDTAIERRWARYYRGMIYALRDDDEVERWRMSPLYSDEDVISAELGEEATEEALWSQMTSVDFDAVRALKCPFFILTGAEDRTTPTSIARAFFNQVSAPQKRFMEVPRAAHYLMAEKPGEVLLNLVQHVRPTAR